MNNVKLLRYAIIGILLLPSLGSSQNNSAYFNGSIEPRIRVADANPINPSSNPSAYNITGTAITVEAWIYPTGFPDTQFTNCIVQRPVTPFPSDPYSIYELNIWHGYPTGGPATRLGAPTKGDWA